MKYLYITEAADDLKKIDTMKKELKKKLNTCKLTNFKSETECTDFYSVFFCNSVPKDFTITATEWFALYQDLLQEPKFFDNLVYYIAAWKPENYTMLFRGLRSLVDTELEEIKKDRIVYISKMCSSMTRLSDRFNSIRVLLSKQLFQPELMQFIRTICSTTKQYEFELNELLKQEIKHADDTNSDGLRRFVRNDDLISEECQELLECLNTLRSMLEDYNAINEGIVSTAKDRANQALVKKRRIEDYMDRTVFKAYDNWRKRKETKNHEEMMGETLKLSTMIKKVIQVGIGYIAFGGIGAIITAIVTHAIDRKTSKDDRVKILTDIKDEIEIVDEKISIADKNNDEKAKIEMMRIRQKLRREYERMSRGITHKAP